MDKKLGIQGSCKVSETTFTLKAVLIFLNRKTKKSFEIKLFQKMWSVSALLTREFLDDLTSDFHIFSKVITLVISLYSGPQTQFYPKYPLHIILNTKTDA